MDVVVATPGRLLDHMERQNVSFDDLEVLVLDEADRMLDMGFAPQLNRIVAEIPPYRQTLLFSATMPPEVEALARKYLRKPVVVQVGRRSEAASTVTHAVYPVPRDRKSTLLVELLKEANMDSVLIFTRTKHGADRVVRHLEDQGIAATAMHADKSQGERTRALEDFKSGKIRVLVATDIAQRGLDVSASVTSSTTMCPSSRKTTCTASVALAAPPRPAMPTPSCRPTRSRWCAPSSA